MDDNKSGFSNNQNNEKKEYYPLKIEKNVGDILLREKLISIEQLHHAQQEQKKSGEKLNYTLARLGYLDETQLVDVLSKQYGMSSINLDECDISPEVIKLIPKEFASQHACVPVDRRGNTLIVAIMDPANIYVVDDLKFLTGLNIETMIASETALKKALEKYYSVSEFHSLTEVIDKAGETIDESDINVLQDEDQTDIAQLGKEAEEAPVIRLVNMVLIDAIKRGASDIHIEPYDKDFRIRYRIDGMLYEMMKPPKKLKNAITSRLKIMSQLDIAERRLPQDGRIRLVLGKDKEVDFRVSVLPTLHGEKIVLRILDRSALQLDMSVLGFDEIQLRQFREAIHEPWGMVLVTGPTGSGKTTTLYSALAELNRTTENISTAEDPVEINLPGINQVQMKEEIGLNFASTLRSFLRQDPDIIMVGEIRDFETAEIAVKAALTGHLVLSTIHTNDAPSTINRLLNMGIEPFLVTASLIMICAQRLVRKVCSECKEEIQVSPQVLMNMGYSEEDSHKIKTYKGRGCSLCNNTGYKGRKALYEIMPVTDELKECILQGYSSIELKREAMRMGMMTLRGSGLKKIRDGVTALEEVMRVTRSD
jgi:type IV pilus assembly protein PilB